MFLGGAALLVGGAKAVHTHEEMQLSPKFKQDLKPVLETYAKLSKVDPGTDPQFKPTLDTLGDQIRVLGFGDTERELDITKRLSKLETDELLYWSAARNAKMCDQHTEKRWQSVNGNWVTKASCHDGMDSLVKERKDYVGNDALVLPSMQETE
jgi:hypothetical protein